MWGARDDVGTGSASPAGASTEVRANYIANRGGGELNLSGMPSKFRVARIGRRGNRRARSHEQGSVVAIVTVILAGLVGVAGLSALQVRKSLGVAAHDRARSQALYAAESGLASATAFLRLRVAQGAFWSAYVSPSNSSPQSPTDILGNNDAPGTGDNPFTTDTWYAVTILNNIDDPQFAAGSDGDGRLVIRSVGHSSGGARVVLEMMVAGETAAPADLLCVGYAQQGMSELGAGRNDCLSDINSGDSATYTPGVP